MRVIPLFYALLTCITLSACSGIPPYSARELPAVRNPAGEIPEVWGWFGGHTPLVLGADSACGIPVVIFPEVAALCGCTGDKTAPIGVSWGRGCPPVVAYSHVVTAHEAPVKGLIGWSVIRRFVWHLDLARNRHEFTDAVPQSVQGWANLPLSAASNIARVQLPGCGECVIDTGAPYGLYLSPEEWRRFLASHPAAEVGLYFGESPAAGGSFCHPYTQVAHLQLGPLHLRNIRVCETFSRMTGPRMLGREALTQFDIWVDGPRLRLYYRPLQ